MSLSLSPQLMTMMSVTFTRFSELNYRKRGSGASRLMVGTLHRNRSATGSIPARGFAASVFTNAPG
jgi:hypothetical protein